MKKKNKKNKIIQQTIGAFVLFIILIITTSITTIITTKIIGC